ncbi:MAG: hypothetical protein LBP65_01865 [Puniceicoccales bacterium]|nr:hypothetical protein [Puniceicoccales bacterium]
MGKSIHVVLDPRVCVALREEARRKGTSVSKVAQRAIVAELKVRDVPVFTVEDLEERVPGPNAIPGKKMTLRSADVEGNGERASRPYDSAEELLGDLHRAVGLDA